MQHPDVDRTFDRGLELREQAFRSMPAGKTDAMDPDTVREPHFAAVTVEDVHVIRKAQFAGQGVLGVMVALDIEHANPAFAQAVELQRQEGGCPRAARLAIEQIACDQQGGHIPGKCDVNDPGKRGAGRGPNLILQIRVAQGKRSQRRVEMYISGVKDFNQ